MRWVDTYTGDTFREDQLADITDPSKLVKLTGTYRRKVPPKVKRRERINFNGIPTLNNGDSVPKTAIIYAEWEE